MPTVLVGSDEKKGADVVTRVSTVSDIEAKGTVVEEKEIVIPPLGSEVEEKRFWFQRGKTYDPNAIATLVSDFSLPRSTVIALPLVRPAARPPSILISHPGPCKKTKPSALYPRVCATAHALLEYC